MSLQRVRPSILLFLLVLNAAAALWYFSMMRQKNAPVRVHVPAPMSASSGLALPEFSLKDSRGSLVSRADFAGRPWVAAFIYTDCPAQCPMLTSKMSALQQALPDEVGLVSISVNPEKDTPEILAAYAERNHADAKRWKFLTGSKAEVEKILSGLGAPSNISPEAHSLRLYLLDSTGSVAGLFDSSDHNAVQQLTAAARHMTGKEK